MGNLTRRTYRLTFPASILHLLGWPFKRAFVRGLPFPEGLGRLFPRPNRVHSRTDGAFFSQHPLDLDGLSRSVLTESSIRVGLSRTYSAVSRQPELWFTQPAGPVKNRKNTGTLRCESPRQIKYSPYVPRNILVLGYMTS